MALADDIQMLRYLVASHTLVKVDEFNYTGRDSQVSETGVRYGLNCTIAKLPNGTINQVKWNVQPRPTKALKKKKRHTPNGL